MSESVLRSHIRALRQVLGAGIIETVIGRGYRFQVEVREGDASLQTRVTAAGSQVAEARSSSLVGRAPELAELSAALESARRGTRRLVFVAGDAGVGKTALVDAFLERLQGTAWSGRGACVEQYGSGEAYLPVLAAAGQICVGPGGDRFVEMMSRHSPTWLAMIPALVTRNRVRVQQGVAGATQAGMLREAAEGLEALSSDKTPVVLALEDLHWSDASTVELLAFLGRRREPDRLLVIGTYRPMELARTHPLTQVLGELVAHKQATQLVLDTFSEDAVAEYVDARFAGHRFPRELASTVYRTTGGNPLFVVTLCDDLEARQMIRSVDGRWELTTSVEDVASRRPDSIRRLLDLQIDRLSVTEQRIVEAGSVAGNTFAAGVVAQALSMAVDDVDSCCESLANEHRFLRYLGSEAWPDGSIQSRYGFAHALYQHAALARNPSVRLLHRRIAERLEAGYSDKASTIAPELAMHFGKGHEFSKAAHYCVLAGERAARQHGNYEALGHFEQARAHVARLPEGRERDELELRVLHGLGPCLMVFKPMGAPELVSALTRAAELAKRVARERDVCAALVGLQYHRLWKGDLREVGEHRDELTQLAGRLSDPSLGEMVSFIASCASLFLGQLSEAERGLTWLDARGDHPREPIVLARANLALLAWLAGRPDEALERGRAAVSAAEALGDPFALATALYTVGIANTWRRDAALALQCGRRALDVATEARFAMWQGRASLLVHWASSDIDPAASAARLDEHLAELKGAPRLGVPLDTLAVVDILARAGRHSVALEKLSEAIDFMEQANVRVVEPELYRLRGELLKSIDRDEAERSLARAIEVARHQSSRSFELRAAMSLHRFQSGAKKKNALEDVRRVLETFTEGFETGDLLDARALLAE
jgi:tetratricopeptide (TPR) repeat protein